MLAKTLVPDLVFIQAQDILSRSEFVYKSNVTIILMNDQDYKMVLASSSLMKSIAFQTPNVSDIIIYSKHSSQEK